MNVSRYDFRELVLQNSSNSKAWERRAFNAEAVVLVTNVPLAPGKTYVQVLATSDTEASAKKWKSKIMKAIKETGLTKID